MDYSQGAESNLFHQVMNRAVRKPNFQKGSAPSNSCWKQSCRENPATSWPCLSKSWQFWKPALGFPTCILCTVPYTHQARQLHALPWMSFICRVTKTTCGTSRCSWGEYKEKSLYPSFLLFFFFFSPNSPDGAMQPSLDRLKAGKVEAVRPEELTVVLIKLSGLTYSICCFSVLLHLKQDGGIMQMSHCIVPGSETLSCMLGIAWIRFYTPECPQLWTVLVG